MRNLQEATERICELKGSLVALETLAAAMLHVISDEQRQRLRQVLERHAEVARSVLIHAPISELTIGAFEHSVARSLGLIGDAAAPRRSVEPMMRTTVRIHTFEGPRVLTAATGFFFERDARLFLVTSRHVLLDEASGHRPDHIALRLHCDESDLTRCSDCAVPLYRQGQAGWRESRDGSGVIDVAALEIDRAALPPSALLRAFTPAHLPGPQATVEAACPVAIVGFAPGLQDAVHHLPLVRQASIASSYGVPYQGRGCFLLDTRGQAGLSGSPVLGSAPHAGQRADGLPWLLLGVLSARLGAGDGGDDAGLGRAWYAEVLMALTAA
ncbi:trypsin-like peptidase domain-containing protein [Aquabacterium sp. OR-4]|uniref:trypsin-like peptidase domain-containing protein n=1 Tax=Aquabacterium sp. OR-4 TaxID=2978127 RepID=UPI0021B2A30A|nr:serine protease [Aquabacterium sp. OR-4]MDT7834203.1 serine protease [Aquabacterium sp. OR-4]